MRVGFCAAGGNFWARRIQLCACVGCALHDNGSGMFAPFALLKFVCHPFYWMAISWVAIAATYVASAAVGELYHWHVQPFRSLVRNMCDWSLTAAAKFVPWQACLLCMHFCPAGCLLHMGKGKGCLLSIRPPSTAMPAFDLSELACPSPVEAKTLKEFHHFKTFHIRTWCV